MHCVAVFNRELEPKQLGSNTDQYKSHRICFSSIIGVSSLYGDHATCVCIFACVFNIAAQRLDNSKPTRNYVFKPLNCGCVKEWHETSA